jgi:hypothetical protein
MVLLHLKLGCPHLSESLTMAQIAQIGEASTGFLMELHSLLEPLATSSPVGQEMATDLDGICKTWTTAHSAVVLLTTFQDLHTS